MSLVSALINSNKTFAFEQAFGVQDITSTEMQKAIEDWYRLYYAQDLEPKEDPCQRLPVAIVSKLTKTTFSEYEACTTLSGSKGEYIGNVLAAMNKVRKRAMQNAFIGGECLLKPILGEHGIYFVPIKRQNYLILARNELDEIVDIGTQETTHIGKTTYTLLERRTVDGAGYLTIESRLYRSNNDDMLGTQVPLDTLDKYAMLEPINRLPKPVGSLGLIPLRVPLENCVDGSPDSVSVYASAAGLIHLININEAQINGEFERGKSRLIVSADLMEFDENGRKELTGEVFTALDHAPDEIGVTIFSPTFREQSYLARKTEYLRNCESLIGLKRGILSEVEAAERTAKEITSSEGDYNLTIIDLQEMWESAVHEAVRVCDILGQMYKLCDSTKVDPDEDISVSWGNGILYDRDKVWLDYTNMVASGLLRPEIAIAWYFDLPCETPEDMAKIREKYMPEINTLLGGE